MGKVKAALSRAASLHYKGRFALIFQVEQKKENSSNGRTMVSKARHSIVTRYSAVD
jgi:hypothetical protein